MSAERVAATPAPLLRLRERAERLGDRLPALLVEAERVAATVAQGVHGRRRTGTGETFWQFRLYQPGDDARSIDWRQSARAAQHHFVREQEWEAAESVWIWCDRSPSMRYRSPPVAEAKEERALLLTIALSVLLVRAGERVALLGTDEPPRSGRFGLDALCRGLAASAASDTLPPVVRLPRHARLVLISDFLAPVEGWKRVFTRYTGLGLRAAVLQITDPAEEELPFEGRVLFEGPEAEGRHLIGNVREIRSRYRRLFGAHRDRLRQLCLARGWNFAVHRTDRAAAAGLLTLYQMLAPGAVD
ncbi:MAG TPA: DUF58 domain-containing protein [Rhodospirillales bacterium]|nr:DUF58 domain-containing protein [Rhodospirillales bacterium]